jgi:hypothetical protein
MTFAGILVTSLAIGCGGGDDDPENNADRYEGTEAEVAALIDEFGEAGRNGDGERVCEEIFTEALATNVARESGQTCPAEVEENLPEDDYELTVDSIEIDGTAATVHVTDESDNESLLTLVKAGGEWRVLRVTEG